MKPQQKQRSTKKSIPAKAALRGRATKDQAIKNSARSPRVSRVKSAPKVKALGDKDSGTRDAVVAEEAGKISIRSRRPEPIDPTVDDVCKILEAIAPLSFAQDWDNVGLIAGDRLVVVHHILLTIDLTPATALEAIEKNCDMIISYHPPFLQPIRSITNRSAGAESALLTCLRRGISVYSPHTALDAAGGGTNDALAALVGVENSSPLEYGSDGRQEFKIVVFVPRGHVDRVAGAMFEAGSGRIGNYSHCSFRLGGTGTFMGNGAASPTVGKPRRFEAIEEVRLESITQDSALPQVIAALRRAHPYEEPAFDVYSLHPKPEAGIGRVANLPRPKALKKLAKEIKRAGRAKAVQIVGDPDRDISRLIIVAGAAGGIPFRRPLEPGDCIVTGEIRHHDALTVLRRGCCAIAMGHWASERPVLAKLGDRLHEAAPTVDIRIAQADVDPFDSV